MQDTVAPIYVDSPDDYIFGSHFTLMLDDHTEGHALPKFPVCPGPQLVSHAATISRPDPSPEFICNYPVEAKIYADVISHKLPNYLGAKRDVPHQINIPEWRH